jgi:DNA-binding response OmpR family regulator
VAGKTSNLEVILIVDDEKFMRQLMREALARAGYAVVEADTGERAQELFLASRPDAVLLDVYLPGMEGFEACQAIRRLPGGEHTPILMVTGGGEEELIHRAYEVDATDFIGKPVNSTVLGYRVRYMLRAARMAAGIREIQKRLALTQRIAGLGYYEWDVVQNVWVFSEESRQILGLAGAVAEDLAPFTGRFTPRKG